MYTSGLLLMCEIEFDEKDLKQTKFERIIENKISQM